MTLLRLVIILPVVALLTSIDNRNCIINHSLLFVDANVPPTSSGGSRFTRKRNKSRASSDASSSSDGLTLGDLEALQHQSKNNGGGGNFIPSEAIFGQHYQQREQLQQGSVPKEEESTSDGQNQPARRSLRRINLDLSGRVMCHVLSPKLTQIDEDGDDRLALRMDSMPLFEATSSRFDSNKKLRRLQRHIPHVYIGANYDLDEIWYGATRWIAKCSWCLPKQSKFDESNRARQLVESIFPTTAATKRPAWRLDLEREHSVFEHSDSTTRVSLLQHQSSYHSSTAVRNLSVEYDSAKYSNNNRHDVDIPTMVQAPTISVNVQTPVLHPRIELRTKKTWILQNGGDKHGNYYGGAHYGSYSPVERRLESIRDGYRALVPRSQILNLDGDSTTSSMSAAATTMGRLQSFGRKLSNWLEQDGWMPKRVTTDLMGNFVSVNEVGFSSETTNQGSNNNMGIRLRISKRIDWTSLGIFPWSNNNNPNHGNNSPTTPTRVRLDLCGLHNSGNSKSQIGCEFDPLCLGDTFRVVIGHDGVGE